MRRGKKVTDRVKQISLVHTYLHTQFPPVSLVIKHAVITRGRK